MNGVHDMGGMHGFGKVVTEPNEPPFHETWEGRVLGMQRLTGALGLWNIDIGRFSLETLPPHVYLGVSYYHKWFLGLEKRVLQYGLVDAAELAAGHAATPAKPTPRPMVTGAAVDQLLVRSNYERPTNQPARFKPGERVRARNIHPETHTRLPRYVRDHVGTVEAIRGCHVFPDAVVLGRGEDPKWLYTVVFDGRELWGDDADPTLKVSVDAWEPYLDPA